MVIVSRIAVRERERGRERKKKDGGDNVKDVYFTKKEKEHSILPLAILYTNGI